MIPRFSVSNFIAVVNQTFDVAFAGMVEVEGEVSSFKSYPPKYAFFDLKDDDGLVRCFVGYSNLRTPIEDGMKVVVRAMPVLRDKGAFSLNVQEIRPLGKGSLKRSFDLLKQKLTVEGLFNSERKRPLPQYPQRVAIISSTKAAGYADFMKISGERWGGVKFIVANVNVQGANAADQAVRAISYFNQMSESPDVIVLIRGGGSAEDLAELVESRGLSAGLLGNPVEEEFIPQTGIIETDDQGNFVRIIEKPKLEEAPSNLSNSSFYVLNKEIFELARTLPANPKRGEFELTDAINAYIDGGGVIVVGEAKGKYMECGSPSGWLKANNAIAKTLLANRT